MFLQYKWSILTGFAIRATRVLFVSIVQLPENVFTDLRMKIPQDFGMMCKYEDYFIEQNLRHAMPLFTKPFNSIMD